jgi:single-strand DNA-binding protein
MNVVILVGRLTDNPEIRSTSGGKEVANFSMATNEYRGGQQVAEYHQCVAWDKLANTIGQFAKKGSLVEIVGRLQTRKYVNRENITVKVTEIIVSQFSFGERSRSDESARPQRHEEDLSDLPF